jgi:hypothetical protein
MNGTTTRTPSTRARDDRRGGYVSGANALKIGYAEPAPDRSSGRRTGRGRGEPHPTAGRRTEPRSRGRSDATDTPPRRAALPLPITLPRARFLVVAAVVLVVGVVGVLVVNTKINENAFQLDDLRTRQAALDLQEQQLAQDLAERESPGNLRAAARRLGLVPAESPAFISLPDGRVVGVPRPATDGLALNQLPATVEVPASPLPTEAGR